MASLIGFDTNRQNLEFKGYCKLSVNFLSNYLYVEPENEAFKMISASFKLKYVMKKNLLFVFAEFNFMDFCLEFKNEGICKKILDGIHSVNKDTEIAEELPIDTSFINPIFEKIAENSTFNSDLIETIATWHQLLDEEDKEKYSSLMKGYGIHDLIVTAIQQRRAGSMEKESRINRKRKFCDTKKEECSDDDIEDESQSKATYTKIIPSSEFQLMYDPTLGKRRLFVTSSSGNYYEYKPMKKNTVFKCMKCEHSAIVDVDDNDEICVKLEGKKHSCKPSKTIPEKYEPIKTIRKPDYEFFENCAGKFKNALVIFDSDDRTQCHEYSWDKKFKKFYCGACFVLKKKMLPKAIICYQGTPKEYVEILTHNHGCQKRKFKPEKFNQYFKYVLQPYFEIRKFWKNGKELKRLIIYDKDDRSKSFQYLHSAQQNRYFCLGCRQNKQYVSAKLRQNFDAEEYLILSNAKHVCEMRSHIPKIILQPPEFEYMKETKVGFPKIFVFIKNDRTKCYIFNRDGTFFFCGACKLNGRKMRKMNVKKSVIKCVTGKLVKNEETGIYTFQMRPNQIHICEPKKYEREKFQIPPKTYDFFYFQKKKEPQFLKLAIKHPENRNLCFIFIKKKGQNFFYCTKCNGKNKCISTKPQKDADGKEYLDHDFAKHICEPIEISTISPPQYVILKEHPLVNIKSKRNPKMDESKIVKMPNFELRPNEAGIPDKRLVILHPTDKSLCFQYSYINEKRCFLCCKCQWKKVYVSAKLHKDKNNNEESFILMGKNDHVCEPSKYQPLLNNDNRIVDILNFELRPNKAGVPDKKLIIRHPKDKSLCYEYVFCNTNQLFKCSECSAHKTRVTAMLQKDDKKIVLDNNVHVCEPLKYESIKFAESKIVKKPNFELRPNTSGVPDKQLILHHPTDKTLCYQFYFHNSCKTFVCWKCESKNKHVSAKLHKNDNEKNEEAFVVMGNNEHVCKPIKYQPIVDIEDKTVRMPNFKLNPNKFGVPDRKLIIFEPTDKSLCFHYYYDAHSKAFRCHACAKNKIYVNAKLHKDEKNNESFIVMGKSDHICKPTKYQSL